MKPTLHWAYSHRRLFAWAILYYLTTSLSQRQPRRFTKILIERHFI